MARAKRHYLPGHVWHITHRCHKKEFLLKFGRDRRRWVEWLFEAKKRYGLKVLNYIVTSNHIHLLVVDGDSRNVILDSIKLIAGRTAQEYNQRKNRKGAFSGYNEIQNPRKRYSIIDYSTLKDLLFQFSDYNALVKSHFRWLDDAVKSNNSVRQEQWTQSIAVGSKTFL